ncbi:MAG: prepilin peptidase [Patescibacteria group bacterium]|jgi:leader peptidase (prepilin peptidase)/N-methyltransferase
MEALFVLFFGLVIGSFLNVVICRLGHKKSFIAGRSACPKCHKKIVWYDNIPLLSYLILQGRCRQCGKSISWQYPSVELATAIIFLCLFLNFGLSAQFFVALIFSSFLLVIFVYDLKHYLILDQVIIPAAVIAFLANIFLGFSIWSLIIAALVGAGFFALQFIVSSGQWVGDGDIRLGALMGLMLGWPLLLVALFLAYLIGAIFGLILIALNKKKMSSQIPFGPFLSGATFLTFIYGQDLLNWYFHLIYF